MSDPDLLKKLELMANLDSGDMVPAEVAPDPWNWGEPVRKLFADALEAIESLTKELVLAKAKNRMMVGDGLPLFSISHPHSSVDYSEPWASPYVMDLNNWK